MRQTIADSVEELVYETLGQGLSRSQECKPLPVDLLENDEEFLLVFDAPGASARDIQIDYDDGTVSVRVDRFRDYYDEYELQVPGRGLTLRGTASLPGDAHVDPEQARATLTETGTVQIFLPKVNVSE